MTEPDERAFDAECNDGDIYIDERAKRLYRWRKNIWVEDVNVDPEAVQIAVLLMKAKAQ